MITFLEEPALVSEETGAAGTDWVRFDASTHLPYDAANIYLRAWVLADGASTKGSIEYRANDNSPEYSIVASGLVETADQNSEAVMIAELPLDPGGLGFEWRAVVTGDLDWKIEILGYAERQAPPKLKRHK